MDRVQMDLLWRQGCLSRSPMAPRGWWAEAATSRWSITNGFTKEQCTAIIQNQTADRETRLAAARVLGEYGDAEDLNVLFDYAWYDHRALHLISDIGGPSAVAFLMGLLENHCRTVENRVTALTCLLDMATGGWEMYQMSSGPRVVLPPYLQASIERLRSGEGELPHVYRNMKQSFEWTMFDDPEEGVGL